MPQPGSVLALLLYTVVQIPHLMCGSMLAHGLLLTEVYHYQQTGLQAAFK
jgi:hypothetical protein